MSTKSVSDLFCELSPLQFHTNRLRTPPVCPYVVGSQRRPFTNSLLWVSRHGIPLRLQRLNSGKGRRKRESKNKKQETKRFSTFAVSRLRHFETKKNIA